MEEEIQMNKMGVAPIKKLMLAMGVPMILSMILQAFYNIVDSYFVSCINETGEYGINALTLAFPIQMLMVAIGVGMGVGINAILSKSLGQGNQEKASKIAGNAVFLGLCTYVVFLLFGLFGVNAYMSSQTSDATILQMGNAYLTICTTLSFGIMLSMIYEKLLQAAGKTGLSTIAQLAGAAINIVLDPIMIFGWLGCPKLGISGAAYATVIGQTVTMLLGAFFHYKLNKEVKSKLIYLKPEVAIIGSIYQVGFPAIIIQALMSFMTYGVNLIFGTVSSELVTAYGVYYKIQQFVFFAAFGLNNALIPIVAFNYGMEDRRRVNDGIKYGLIYTLVIMGLGAIALELFANQIAGVFSLSAETQTLCARAIRIISLGYLFAGANIAFQGIFQALRYGVHSLFVSLLRLIVIALPSAWVLTLLPNASQVVWITFPMAEGLALIAAIVMMQKISKERLQSI
ncbi:MAG: MATE family efflux transporter [Eubacteriales bacterium]